MSPVSEQHIRLYKKTTNKDPFKNHRSLIVNLLGH